MGGEENNNPEKPKKSFKVKHQERMSACSKFCWDSDRGTCMGRKPMSWLQILSYYLVFYCGLTVLWTICMAVFLQTLDNIAPTQQGMFSMLKNNPGMGFWPTSASDSTLIYFQSNNVSSYNVTYVQALNDTITKQWVTANYSNLRPNCVFGGQVADYDAACNYNYVENFGLNCTVENNFGYSIGKPCVLIRINKIYGWDPRTDLFDGTMGPKETEFKLISNTTKSSNKPGSGFIPVSCQGENDGDNDHIQKVTFYPDNGFNSIYFPYFNQDPYVAPGVMAQFEITHGVAVMFWCKIWTKNIIHDRTDGQASFHFELYITNNASDPLVQ